MAKKQKKEGYPSLSQLQSELYQTRDALEGAYARFNAADDPELVEANIFAINALQCKQNYLLRCIKIRTGQPISRPVTMKATVKAAKPPEAVAAASMKGEQICHW